MKRKLTALTLCGVMLCSAALPSAAVSRDYTPVLYSAQSETALPDSVLYFGGIDDIIRDKDGNISQLRMTSEKYGEYVMNISSDTLWIDDGRHIKDNPSTLNEGESVYIFHSPVSTKSLPPQSSAIAVLRNTPMDAGCAWYHVVKSVSNEGGQVRLTVDGGDLIINTGKDTVITRYDDPSSVSLMGIEAGDRIMAWYNGVEESYPARTDASCIMLLPDEKDELPATRAQLISMLHKKEGSPVVNFAMNYTDVKEGDDFAEAIRWGTSEKIVNGYDNGAFGCGDSVTREQAAVMLYRYARTKGEGFVGAWAFPLDFADADKVSDYAYEAVCWFTMKGVMTAADGENFLPQGEITVHEAETALQKLADILK